MKKTSRGVVAIFASSLSYSLYGIFSKKYIVGHFDPFYQSWTRAIITVSCFLILALFLKGSSFRKIAKKDRKNFALMCLLGSSAAAPTYYSLAYMNLGTSLFIQYGSGLMCGYVLAALILKEKLTPIKYIALLLALVGLVSVYWGEVHVQSFLPVVAAVLSGSLFTAAMVISKKMDYSFIQINTFAHLTIIAVNLPVSMIIGEKCNIDFASAPWFANVGYGVAGFMGSALAVYGYKFIEASKGSLLVLSEIIFGVLFGFFIFGETLNAMAIVGGLLILLAITLKSIVGLFKEKIP